MKTYHQRAKDHHGFTLFELLVILMILGIVAAHAFPTLQGGLAGSKRSAGAAEVAIALEYAQLNAITTGVQTRVTFNSGADTILVEQYKISGTITGSATVIPQNDIDTGAFATMAHPSKRGENYLIIFANEDRLNGVDIVSASFGVNNYVTFNAQGAASAGGTVTLAYGGRQATVTVDALSGKVTTSE